MCPDPMSLTITAFSPAQTLPAWEQHPITGCKARDSANSTWVRVEGMSETDAPELLQQYCEYALAPSVQFTHQYEIEHVVICDNVAIAHAGVKLERVSGGTDPRNMHRVECARLAIAFAGVEEVKPRCLNNDGKFGLNHQRDSQ